MAPVTHLSQLSVQIQQCYIYFLCLDIHKNTDRTCLILCSKVPCLMVMSLILLPIGQIKIQFKAYFPSFTTHNHTLTYPKTKKGKPRIRLKHSNNTVAVRGGDKNVEEGACGDTIDGMVIECDQVKIGKSQIFIVIFLLFCRQSGLSLNGRGRGFPPATFRGKQKKNGIKRNLWLFFSWSLLVVITIYWAT